MTTTRPYRKALDVREALRRLEDAAGHAARRAPRHGRSSRASRRPPTRRCRARTSSRSALDAVPPGRLTWADASPASLAASAHRPSLVALPPASWLGRGAAGRSSRSPGHDRPRRCDDGLASRSRTAAARRQRRPRLREDRDPERRSTSAPTTVTDEPSGTAWLASIERQHDGHDPGLERRRSTRSPTTRTTRSPSEIVVTGTDAGHVRLGRRRRSSRRTATRTSTTRP